MSDECSVRFCSSSWLLSWWVLVLTPSKLHGSEGKEQSITVIEAKERGNQAGVKTKKNSFSSEKNLYWDLFCTGAHMPSRSTRKSDLRSRLADARLQIRCTNQVPFNIMLCYSQQRDKWRKKRKTKAKPTFKSSIELCMQYNKQRTNWVEASQKFK